MPQSCNNTYFINKTALSRHYVFPDLHHQYDHHHFFNTCLMTQWFALYLPEVYRRWFFGKCSLFVHNKLPLFSLLLWASCTNALIMVWWLFVPTSSAGQTCHPFYFGESWYWSLLSVASFSLLAGISVSVRENTSLPICLGHTHCMH